MSGRPCWARWRRCEAAAARNVRAAVAERFGNVGPERERLVITGERLLCAALGEQNVAKHPVGAGMPGLGRDGTPKSALGLLEP